MPILSKPIPYSIEHLEAVFILDRENGLLIRIVPTAGRKRGVIPPKGNYRRVKLDGELYFEHRVIWMMEHRQCIPDGVEIDHISRDHHDNRPANLRLAVRQQNMVNSTAPIGRSGYRGVRRSRNGKFQANIVCNAVRHNLGTFSTAQEAAAVYDLAAVRLNAEFALTNAMLGLLPTVPAPAAPVQAPALHPALASRSYPGVPDMPLPFPRCAPAWSRPASPRAITCTSNSI